MKQNEQEIRERLYKLYWEDEYSLRQIAELEGLSYSGVQYRFNKYNIPKRTDIQGMNTARNRQIRHVNMSGENNHAWEGGRRVTSHGYIEVYSPNHPNKSARNTVYEHRLVMEEHLGRYLTKEEEVHHIDEDKRNNKIENLMLFANAAEHAKHHAELNKTK